MTHTEESLMELAYEWADSSPGSTEEWKAFKALRLAIREVLAERDDAWETIEQLKLAHSATGQRAEKAEAELATTKARLLEVQQDVRDLLGLKERAERAEAENLQRGNVIGRITAHLLGNKNNVTDEDVVIAAAEVGRELQGAIERIKRSDKACPVAWMVYTKDGKSVFVTDNPTDIPAECAALPLFTSPPAAPAPDAATVELPPLPDIEQEVYARTRTFLRNDEIVAVGQLMEVYASEAIRAAHPAPAPALRRNLHVSPDADDGYTDYAAPAPETVAWMIVEPGCEYGPTFGTENAAWSALTKAPPGSELVELVRRKQ